MRRLHCLTIIMLISTFFSCKKDSTDHYLFTLEPSYESIKSYPGGEGIFILRLKNQQETNEKVALQLKCDQCLNASLTKNSVAEDQQAFEVQIKPNANTPPGDYIIEVVGLRKDQSKTVQLKVQIIEWSNTNGMSEIAANKLTGFINWINKEYPNIAISDQTHWDVYSTYPHIMIVEHCTLLSDQYEMRICCHIMIPPDDWSMIRLRERNSFAPFLAVRQNATGQPIYSIPITDYPELYGY